jgi:hypothetical protein
VRGMSDAKPCLRKRQNLPACLKANLRIESLSWALLALDAEKQRLLRGEAGSISLWQDMCDRLQGLCPKSDVLRVHFIDGSDICIKCRAPMPPAEEREPIKPPAQPVHASNRDTATFSTADDDPNAPATAPAPARPQAPAPSNVMPLAFTITFLAPLAREEPWRSSIGSEFSAVRRTREFLTMPTTAEVIEHRIGRGHRRRG